MAAVRPTVLAQGTVQGSSAQLPAVDVPAGGMIVLAVAAASETGIPFGQATSPNLGIISTFGGGSMYNVWIFGVARASADLTGEVITVTFEAADAIAAYVLMLQPQVPSDIYTDWRSTPAMSPTGAQAHLWVPCFIADAQPLRAIGFLFHWPSAGLVTLWPPWRLLAHQLSTACGVLLAYTEGFPHVLEVRMSADVDWSAGVVYPPCVDAACLLLEDEPVFLDRTNVLPLTEENEDGIWAVVT